MAISGMCFTTRKYFNSPKGCRNIKAINIIFNTMVIYKPDDFRTELLLKSTLFHLISQFKTSEWWSSIDFKNDDLKSINFDILVFVVVKSSICFKRISFSIFCIERILFRYFALKCVCCFIETPLQMMIFVCEVIFWNFVPMQINW